MVPRVTYFRSLRLDAQTLLPIPRRS